MTTGQPTRHRRKNHMATRKSKKAEVVEETPTRGRRRASDETIATIVEMRDDGAKWHEICEAVGLGAGRVMQYYLSATTPSKEKFKGTDAELVKFIKDARLEQKLSWGKIVALTGYSEAKLKRIFANSATEKQLEAGRRIGRGGRYPAGVTPPERPAKPAAKSAAKKAAPAKAAPAKSAAAAKSKPAAKKAAAPKGKNLADMTEDQAAKALEGRTVTFDDGTKVKVEEFLEMDDTGTITVMDDQGEEVVFEAALVKGYR